MNSRSLLLLAGFALAAVPASAVLTVTEPFDYPAGSLEMAEGGTGMLGGWGVTGNAAVAVNSLSYGSLATSGNKARFTPADEAVDTTVTALRNLAAPFGSNDDGDPSDRAPTYLSAVFQIDSSLDLWASGFGITLFDISTAKSVTIGKPIGSNNWELKTNGLVAGANSNVAADSNPTLLVLKLTYQAWAITDFAIWVNPPENTLGLAEPVAQGTTSTNQGFLFSEISIDSLRAGWHNGGTWNHTVDEIRIGDSWAAVTAPVPEPATYALAAGALALLLARRRRS